jgi:hypothetical protein
MSDLRAVINALADEQANEPCKGGEAREHQPFCVGVFDKTTKHCTCDYPVNTTNGGEKESLAKKIYQWKKYGYYKCNDCGANEIGNPDEHKCTTKGGECICPQFACPVHTYTNKPESTVEQFALDIASVEVINPMETAKELIKLGYTKQPAQQEVEVSREAILHEIRMCTTTEGQFLGGMFLERILALVKGRED